MPQRPRSRWHIQLASNGPFQHPRIVTNYFADPYDMKLAIRGIKFILSLEETVAFKRTNSVALRSSVPECLTLTCGTPGLWECNARHLTFTLHLSR